MNEAASVLAQHELFRWSEEEAKQVINYLIKTGRLKEIKNVFWRKALTTARNGYSELPVGLSGQSPSCAQNVLQENPIIP